MTAATDASPPLAESGIAVADLAQRFGGQVRGDAERQVHAVSSLEQALPDEITFVSGTRYLSQLAQTRAAAVIVGSDIADRVPSGCVALVVDNPYAVFARVAQLFAARVAHRPAAGVDPSASVAADAVVAASAHVAARAVIEPGARIGERCVIGPGCVVGRGASVGDDTVLAANVTVYHGCLLGARCLVHAGAVIGADGFGFAPEAGQWVKIPQIGRVLIGDDVEIGANTTIDRGAMDDTVIGDGCKLDNLIQVGHNVRIGAHTAIAGCAGISGSARIGAHCMIGGGAGIVGHIDICDRAVIGGMTMVTRSITEPGFYTGAFPLMTNHDWERAAVGVRQLDALRRRVRALEQAAQRSVEEPK